VSKTLFEIGEELAGLMEKIPEDGEISPELEAFFAEAQEAEGKKLDGYINVIRLLTGEAATAKAEADAYAAIAKARQARVDQLKSRLKVYLETTGRDKVTTATGRMIRIQKNGGKTPLIRDDAVDVSQLPEDVIIVERKPNEERIREYLAAGIPIPFFHLGEVGKHLRI
jgi:hypothetical protein